MAKAFLEAKGWHVFDDVRPALEELRDRGWTHVVLSNHVPELTALIDALGLGALITAVHCSGCTGVEKPHPRAFEAVFAAHPAARAGWMIGDSLEADVLGARAVGIDEEDFGTTRAARSDEQLGRFLRGEGNGPDRHAAKGLVASPATPTRRSASA